jgi:type I restriction-modification system DNA methylase subunit
MNLSSFLWSVADLLRGKYKPHEYGRIALMNVLPDWIHTGSA